MVDPATAVLGFGPVFVVSTSALEVIGVVTWAAGFVPLLLPGVGSGVAEVLDTVSVTLVALAGAVKLMVRVTALAAPTLRVVRVGKVTLPVVGS